MSATSFQCRSLSGFPETRAFLREKLLALLRPDSAVLDAGCGKANLLISRKDVRELFGVDIDGEAIAANRAITGGEVVDFQKQKPAPARYDGLMSYDVLEHLEAPGAFLRNAITAVKPGGFVFLITPNFSSIFGLISRLLPLGLRHRLVRLSGDLTINDVHYYRANTIDDLARAVREAGCVDVEMHVLNRLPSSPLMRVAFWPSYLLCKLPGCGRWGSGLLCVARKPAHVTEAAA